MMNFGQLLKYLLTRDSSTVTQLNRIEGKIDKLMADIDTLNALETEDGQSLTTLASDVQALLTYLQNLQGQSNPDLSGAIAAAQAIQTGLSTIDTQVKAAIPAAQATLPQSANTPAQQLAPSSASIGSNVGQAPGLQPGGPVPTAKDPAAPTQ